MVFNMATNSVCQWCFFHMLLKHVGQMRRNHIKTEAILKNQDGLEKLNDLCFIAKSKKIGQQPLCEVKGRQDNRIAWRESHMNFSPDFIHSLMLFLQHFTELCISQVSWFQVTKPNHEKIILPRLKFSKPIFDREGKNGYMCHNAHQHTGMQPMGSHKKSRTIFGSGVAGSRCLNDVIKTMFLLIPQLVGWLYSWGGFSHPVEWWKCKFPTTEYK